MEDGDVLEGVDVTAGGGEDVHNEGAVEIRHDIQSFVSEPSAPHAAQLRVCLKFFRTFFSFASCPGVPRFEATAAARPPSPVSSVAWAPGSIDRKSAIDCFFKSSSPMLCWADVVNVVA